MVMMSSELRRSWVPFPAVLLVIASIAPAGSIARAGAEPASTEDRIQQIQEEIGDATAEEAAAIVALEDVRARRSTLDEAVRALDAEMLVETARLAAAREEDDRLTARYVAISMRLDTTRARLRQARGRFDESVATLYRTAGGVATSYAALVLDASGPHDLYAGSRYLARVADARWDAVDALRALREEIERLGRRAEARRLEAVAASAAAEAAREHLAGLRAEQAADRDEVAAEQSTEEHLVAEIRGRLAEYEAELATLQATSSAIGTMLANRQAGQQLAGSFVAVRPVPGEITGGFGERLHPILGVVRMHTGVDMRAGYGAPIAAAAAGEVVWAAWRDGYGNTVIIDHGNQYATLYAHQSAVRVAVGQSVQAGQIVGEVGATGLATGPHLHFEVRVLGVPVDPASHL